MKSHSILDVVPNEILDGILCHLPTTALLPLAGVSRRLRAVTLHILKQRLARAVSEPDHRVMLECYHPAEKLYTPYLYCDYLRADPFTKSDGNGSDAGCLGGAYAHFRPVESDETRSWARRRSALWGRHWDVDDDDGGGGGGGDGDDGVSNGRKESRPSVDLYLDDDESFSQLCTITNIVRLGPKPGLFRSHVNINDGVVRVWRDWLGARARAAAAGRGGEGGAAGGGEMIGGSGEDREVVLWADPYRNVGVRFRVTEKDVRGQHHPVLVANDEQLPVAYRLEFEELLVRSTTLLVMVEKSEVQESSDESKAIVFVLF
ncbi:cyclin-like F-box protein [Thermothelomyces thermophilus ATCC 42464]|uniref:Cyclin-like F-box protein n=1 Tax=Thermothelomyces thermophilus (strain ATCC 42464 / BCRC 31852 / DSM 1799) TaxID=573729 RepID=G2Q1L7_THET4|nr:cyclin-like F-box protein [Thermothelomyces thermophilus ATCC 42464]AEO55008.1 cyclin-like F-box protein [Thermothelomyces thermophilus ATCC 42464]